MRSKGKAKKIAREAETQSWWSVATSASHTDTKASEQAGIHTYRGAWRDGRDLRKTQQPSTSTGLFEEELPQKLSTSAFAPLARGLQQVAFVSY